MVKIKMIKKVFGGSRTFDSTTNDIVLNIGDEFIPIINRHGAVDVFVNGIRLGLYEGEFRFNDMVKK